MHREIEWMACCESMPAGRTAAPHASLDLGLPSIVRGCALSRSVPGGSAPIHLVRGFCPLALLILSRQWCCGHLWLSLLVVCVVSCVSPRRRGAARVPFRLDFLLSALSEGMFWICVPGHDRSGLCTARWASGGTVGHLTWSEIYRSSCNWKKQAGHSASCITQIALFARHMHFFWHCAENGRA